MDLLASAAISGTDSGFNETYGNPEDFRKAIAELQQELSPDQVRTDAAQLTAHGTSPYDHHPASLPDVVVYPESSGDVVKIVKTALKYKVPVVPYSGATSLEGHFKAPSGIGGISVDMNHMNRILEVHPDDSDIIVQPGVKWVDINAYLKKEGIPLFFPVDPGMNATIGGMLSTGCSGTNAVRYGTAKGEWVLNATIVLPNGELIKTRRRSRKSSAGFDTTKLFIGAEGTLGIFTEVTLRLAPVLDTSVAIVQFQDVRNATQAVVEIMNKSVGIQCIELCDDNYLRYINLSGGSPRKWPEMDTILFKFQGPTARAIQEAADISREITAKHGGTGFEFAQSKKEEEEIWDLRKNGILWIQKTLGIGSKAWPTDVCVPVTRLPDLLYETKKDMQDSGIDAVIIGHVGDGNFHAILSYRNEAEMETCKQLVYRMNRRAISLDGTCTGEHGVGIGKRDFLVEELGEGTVELMKTIKRAIDPYNLFNPGKLYPITAHK